MAGHYGDPHLSAADSASALKALQASGLTEGYRGALMLSPTLVTPNNVEARIAFARRMAAAGVASGATEQQVWDAIIAGRNESWFRSGFDALAGAAAKVHAARTPPAGSAPPVATAPPPPVTSTPIDAPRSTDVNAIVIRNGGYW